MTKQELLTQIQNDLGANYYDESNVLSNILDDVIEDALRVSNRKQLAVTDEATSQQIGVLASQIKKATKTIYLQRGAEDVKSQSQSGLSTTYDDAIETLTRDVIRLNKRILM